VQGGDEIVALDNLSTPSPLPLPGAVDLIEGDVIDPPSLPGTFDRVYHLASRASPPRYLEDPIGTLRSGAEGTRQMLDRAQAWSARLILTSTSEIYGDPEVHPQAEDYRGSVDVTSSRACYDEAKRYAEALVYAYRRVDRFSDSRVARVFNTYGPGMDPGDGRVVSNFVVQALRGEPLTIYGDGSQTRSFCFVDDLIEGLIRLADSDVADPVNLGNPVEFTINELADRVAALVGDTGRVFVELPEADPKRRRPDISRARDRLRWEPETGLESGLEQTIRYFEALS
jgi:nucleoside-diphosphate-sugar epimerase